MRPRVRWRGLRGRCRRHPVHSVHARHHLDRGCAFGKPGGRNWFQLYVMREREISYDLARRAAGAGFDTLMFTVDTPDRGHGCATSATASHPAAADTRNRRQRHPRPWWWIDFTTPTLEFASPVPPVETVGELLNAAMDPTISFADLDVIRELWPGGILIKGVQTVQDSVRLRDVGADRVSCCPITVGANSTARPSPSTRSRKYGPSATGSR